MNSDRAAFAATFSSIHATAPRRLTDLSRLCAHPGLLAFPPPLLLPKGRAFFEKWGAAGVFFGRFFGPLRCVTPAVARICAMPLVPFQIANLTSAVLWATAVLAPGRFAAEWLL
jgi:membrane protein DedA with SNARE-associated domain